MGRHSGAVVMSPLVHSKGRLEPVRFVSIPRPGGPEVLEVGQRAAPVPGRGQVLIRTTAATVNPTDLLLRAWGAAEDAPSPWTPGTELAGTIVSVGADTPFRAGQRVFAVVNPRRPEGGAQAELVVVPAASVALTPERVSDVEAATVAMNGLTVLQAFRRLGLPVGSTVGVIGSAGAVGQYAIELGVQAGFRVIGDAKPEDADLVRSFGAHAVVPRSDDPAAAFRAQVRDGVDGLIDAAAVDAAALGAVRDNGVLVTVRRWSGPSERGIRIEPVWVPDDFENAAALAELADHLGAGHLTTRIAETIPMAEVERAHRRLAAGGVRGRIVLTFP